MTIYSKSSPYYNTQIVNNYLDIINFRDIPRERDDILFELIFELHARRFCCPNSRLNNYNGMSGFPMCGLICKSN